MTLMKKSTPFLAGISLAMVMLATVPFASGQEPQKPDPAEYRQHLMKLSNEELYNMVRLAFKQRDVETLVAGVEADVGSGYFVHEYDASEDNDLKALLAVRMLRSETISKPFPPLAILRGGEGVPRYVFMGMIIPLLSERLGDVFQVNDLVADANLRLRTADRLEASINGLPPKSLEPRPSKRPLPVEPAPSAEIPGSETSPPIAVAAGSRSSSSSAWPWAIGVLAILLAGALALKFRAS